MRQRNVKNKKEIIINSDYIILNPSDYKGKWHELFNNNNSIHIEIGMGKGDFITELARENPNINYIGIEKYDSIMAIAIKKITDNIPNLKLIRIDAKDLLNVFNQEIDRIYLNFSDPWPKPRHEKRRLTSSIFLNVYDKLFNKKCEILMKTDNRLLFEYSLMSFSNNGYIIQDISLDLHNSSITNNIQTEYERKFSEKGNAIYYVNVIKNVSF